MRFVSGLHFRCAGARSLPGGGALAGLQRGGRISRLLVQVRDRCGEWCDHGGQFRPFSRLHFRRVRGEIASAAGGRRADLSKPIRPALDPVGSGTMVYERRQVDTLSTGGSGRHAVGKPNPALPNPSQCGSLPVARQADRMQRQRGGPLPRPDTARRDRREDWQVLRHDRRSGG